MGGGGGGGGRRGGGGGIGIGIGIILGPGPGADYDPGPDFDAVERNLKRDADRIREVGSEQKRAQPVAKQPVAKQPQVQAARKLSKPRLPYLTEFATDIDPGLLTLAMANFSQTVEFYRNAFAKAKKNKESKAEIAALTQLGHLYFLAGWFSEAANLYEQSLDLAGQLSDIKAQADAQKALAYTLIAWGNYARGVEYARQSLLLYTGLADILGQQMVLNNLGVMEKNRGLFQEARENFEKSIQANPKNQKLLALILSNMAGLHSSWGVNATAFEFYGKARDAAIQASDPAKEVEVLVAAGKSYMEAGDYQTGLTSLNAALAKVRERAGNADWVMKLLADAYADSGRLSEAESFSKQADYDSSLGRVYLLKSQPDLARKHYELLLQSAVPANNLDEIFTAHVGLGKIYELAGNYGEAGKHYAKALEITEQIRTALLPPERRNFYTSKVNGFSRSEPAKGLVRISLRQNNGTRSIDPSELKRAREFADNLSRNFDFDAFGVPREVLQKETDLANRMASLTTALPALSKESEPRRYSDLTNQIKRAESETKALSQQISSKYKDYAAVRYPKPVTLANALIEPNEYVVMFDLLGDGVGVRLLKGKSSAKSAYINWKVEDLEREIREFRAPFEKVQLDKFDLQKAARLYDRLLRDLLKDVPGGTPLIIIPDGLLALVPFEALVIGGTPKWQQGKGGPYPTDVTYLGDRHPIVYYQSLTALTNTRSLAKKGGHGDRVFVMADPVFTMMDARAQGAGQTVRVAANGRQDSLKLMAAIEDETSGFFKLPRLANTESLAQSLKQLYGEDSDVYTGLESSKSNFLSKVAPRLNTYESIVFATHGFAANGIPGIMEPALALSMVPPGTDGFLTMSEVAGLSMSPEVAALVACQTGVGVKLAGEGVMSMGRAFMSAGAKSVTMSLWSVSEQASVLLMDAFFKNLKKGMGRLEAWTDARRMLRQSQWEHPFFWAAFILVGEPK
jgi:CHAT domain-containing protein